MRQTPTTTTRTVGRTAAPVTQTLHDLWTETAPTYARAETVSETEDREPRRSGQLDRWSQDTARLAEDILTGMGCSIGEYGHGNQLETPKYNALRVLMALVNADGGMGLINYPHNANTAAMVDFAGRWQEGEQLEENTDYLYMYAADTFSALQLMACTLIHTRRGETVYLYKLELLQTPTADDLKLNWQLS